MEERLGRAAAIYGGGLIKSTRDGSYEVRIQENPLRQLICQKNQDDSPVGVHTMHIDYDGIQGYKDAQRRNHHDTKDESLDNPIETRAFAGQRIGCKRTHDDLKDNHGHRYDGGASNRAKDTGL